MNPLFNETTYQLVLTGMLMLAPVVFLLLLFISAPYGRHVRGGWGPQINARAGWLIMEAPASLLMLAVLIWLPFNSVIVLLLLTWQLHYFHRAFLYPFTLRQPRPMPVLIMLMAFLFNSINAYLNGYHFVLRTEQYHGDWFWSPLVLVGLVLFFSGFLINKQADAELRKLRDSSTEYQIPQGWLYQWVSCPNYLGESLQWLGWCLMVQSSAAWVFLLWTLANLVPRAISHHRWYREQFPDYPKDRKAMFPLVL